MKVFTVCCFCWILSVVVCVRRQPQPPVGPQLYNFFGFGGYDPFGLVVAPRHVYSGPYYDEGPVRVAHHHRKRRDIPSSSYGAPIDSYGPPSSSYGPPSSSYGPPSSSYGPPSSSYGAPVDNYNPYPVSSYGSYSGGGGGGGKGGGGKGGGGFFKGIQKKFKGIGNSFDKFMDQYFSENSYDYEPTYYAPDYIPVYYQTYDEGYGGGKGKGGGGKFLNDIGKKFSNGLKKTFDDMQSYGDSAIKGIRDFGYRTRNNFDKFNKETTAKFKDFLFPDPEPIHYIPVQQYEPSSSYGPPPSYGPPATEYGAPTGYGDGHGGHGGYDHGHGGHGGFDHGHGGHGGFDHGHGGFDHGHDHGGLDHGHGGFEGGHGGHGGHGDSSYTSIH